MKLSIIVCVYNEIETIEKILSKIDEVNLPRNISKEIIIIDNNSNDGTKDFLKKKITSDNYKIYYQEKNMGKGNSIIKGINEATGEIREDLFHRLNVVPIELSGLSSRTEDIPLLIEYFKEKLSEINGVQRPNIDIKNGNLYTYNWPGNVRELRNLVERVSILSANETKENINKLIDDILSSSPSTESDQTLLEKSFSSPLKEAREHFEKEYLSAQLKKNHGNISKTADFIGMERSALHRKLKLLGIKGIN